MLNRILQVAKSPIRNQQEGSSSNQKDDTSWNLLPLTPEYDDSEHKNYVKAIEKALLDDGIRNIALTGSYGVGKSSILKEVASRHKNRVVELSLSTLAPFDAFPLDDSVPKQAASPTNRIQQELVKQLLYRQNPHEAPGSRFRRIERFNWKHAGVTAMLLGLVVALVFILSGWTENLVATFPRLLEMGIGIHAIVWISATLLILAIFRQVHGQLYIKQLAAGAATVTLDDKSVSYFDQYLDEIVYFFDLSKQDIVIFEDIDRFEDSMIFETLRSLNTLLNASPQIKKPIRFIYAIKDSIFDQTTLNTEGRSAERQTQATGNESKEGVVEPEPPKMGDPAQDEAERANRTKFFDLVIPVVPFITHRSARDLATQLLAKINHSVEPTLLDLAARYVPDMRLLKNVRNEFIVFHDRVFSGKGGQLGLIDTGLFAMMLYKSTHLADFERIKLGTSNLDSIYLASRMLVNNCIYRISNEQIEIRNRMDRSSVLSSRSAELGERLLGLVNLVAQASDKEAQNPTFSLGQSSFSVDDIKNVTFWRDLIAAEDNLIVSWSTRSGGQQLTFTRNQMKDYLKDSFDPETWVDEDQKALQQEIDAGNEKIHFLRGADMGDLIQRIEFETLYQGKAKNLQAIAQSILSDGLAYHLLLAGHIDRNFTLYTATFHEDRVSLAATNFIIHHAETGIMDEYFALDAESADAVVRERGKDSLKDSALYNIAILDRLLQTYDEAADIMIRSLIEYGDLQTRFMQAYLSSGTERVKFVRRFTRVSPRVLVFLTREVELDDASRLELIGVALCSLNDGTEYRTDKKLSSYLLDRYAELSALTSDRTVTTQASLVAYIFKKSGVALPSLAPLAPSVRQAFVNESLYDINQENLELALDHTTELALDNIKKHSQTVYDYVLMNLESYLEVLDIESPTVAMSEAFQQVLVDVDNYDEARIDEVVERAASDCTITVLTKVPDRALQSLAKGNRFLATFENVSHYFETVGSIDANIAVVLESAKAIAEIDNATDPDKVKVAKAIIAAAQFIKSAETRVMLVSSLDLAEHLSMADLTPENGPLFGHLVKHNLIDDTVAVYDLLAKTTWETRESLITESKQFPNYLSPQLLQKDLVSFLQSGLIDPSVKRIVLERAGEFTALSDAQGMTALASQAITLNVSLGIELLEKMATYGVPAELVLSLITPHIDEIELQRLLSILNSLGGDYPKLTSPGRDRPRIPNTASNRALLERLKREGIVSTYVHEPPNIRVNKRHS